MSKIVPLIPFSFLLRFKEMLAAFPAADKPYAAWVLLEPAGGEWPDGTPRRARAVACTGVSFVELDIPGGYTGPRIVVRWTGRVPPAKVVAKLTFDPRALVPGQVTVLHAESGLCLHTASAPNDPHVVASATVMAFPDLSQVGLSPGGRYDSVQAYLEVGIDARLLAALQAALQGEAAAPFLRLEIPLSAGVLTSLRDVPDARGKVHGVAAVPPGIRMALDPIRVTRSGAARYDDTATGAARAVCFPVRLSEG